MKSLTTEWICEPQEPVTHLFDDDDDQENEPGEWSTREIQALRDHKFISASIKSWNSKASVSEYKLASNSGEQEIEEQRKDSMRVSSDVYDDDGWEEGSPDDDFQMTDDDLEELNEISESIINNRYNPSIEQIEMKDEIKKLLGESIKDHVRRKPKKHNND